MSSKTIIIMKFTRRNIFSLEDNNSPYCVFEGSLKEAKKFCTEKNKKARGCEFYVKTVKTVGLENLDENYQEIKKEKFSE